MTLYWLVYRADDGVAVVLIEAKSLVFARLRAGLADLADGSFTEGHELERGMQKKNPEEDDRPQAVSGRGREAAQHSR
jgi:hypothetical protein